MSEKLDNFDTQIQCDELIEIAHTIKSPWTCVILAKFLEIWKGLILKHGEEHMLNTMSIALDKLVTNSDFETALMVVNEFQKRLMELKFIGHYTEAEKKRLSELGWEI